MLLLGIAGGYSRARSPIAATYNPAARPPVIQAGVGGLSCPETGPLTVAARRNRETSGIEQVITVVRRSNRNTNSSFKFNFFSGRYPDLPVLADHNLSESSLSVQVSNRASGVLAGEGVDE
jgi:hypothetical protein